MNLTVSMGNMTDEPRITETSTGKKKAEFTLALNRMKDGADFPRFIAWEQKAELIENWCHKGTKLMIVGHIQTGSYDNKDGNKVYTTDIVVDRLEFCDRKPKDGSEGQPKENPTDGFMMVPDGIDEEMPFN